MEQMESGPISYDDLLLYVVWKLIDGRERPAWTRIVLSAHRLFPDKFGLPGEDSYPDSSQVDRSILRCRSKGYLTGQRATGYSVTPAGDLRSQQVALRLKHPELAGKTASINKKSKTGRIALHVMNDASFGLYKSNKFDQITDQNICALLLSTIEAENGTRQKTLNRFISEVRSSDSRDLVQFLEWVSANYQHLFATSGRKGIYGK